MTPGSPLTRRCVITVRPCAAHEAERLRALRSRALGEAPAAFRTTREEHERVSAAAWRAHLAARAERGDAALVAEACGEWLGFVFALCQDDGTGRLGGLWVVPEARGRGAGRALVNGGLAWLRAADVRRVLVTVADPNGAARALLSAFGFSSTGEPSELRPGEGVRAEQYELELPPKSLRAPPLHAHV